jgi:hypothetical protein
LAGGALTFVLATCTVSVTHADEVEEPSLDLATRQVLLGQWLDAQARQQRKERRFTGGSVLAVGAAGLGFGLALVAKPANNELSKGGGVALTAAGALGVALGVVRLAVESDAEKVARRYADANRAPLTAYGLGRFEGEFYAASQHAHRVQLVARWLGFATAIAGVAVLISTPLTDLSQGGRVAGYVSGALLLVGGGVNFASSFAMPPPVRAWDAYRGGRAPGATSGKLFGFAPTFGRGHVGVSLLFSPSRY